MAKIIISSKDKRLQEVELKKTISLGREAGDIMIKNPAISARHMKIAKEGERFIVHDLGSTNGTFVNDEKLTGPRELHNGDVITVGKFTLAFENPDEEEVTADADFGFDDLGGRTMVMDAATVRAMMEKEQAGGGGPTARKDENSAPKLFLQQSSGAPKVLKLSKDTTLIGSGDHTDVQIKGLTIGRVAASINRSGDSYLLTYQGGMAKLKVNGDPAETHPLKNGDKFSIGSFQFEFRTEL